MWTQHISAVAFAGFCLVASSVAAQDAQVEVTRIGVYPSMPTFIAVAPTPRPCTQLEMSANIEKQLCGTLQLSEVVHRLWPSYAD